MKTTIIIICLFWVTYLYAAQTFTIPQGTTIFGPVNASSLKKYANFAIDRSLWTNPAITLNATFEYSTDGGKTWLFMCGFTSNGSATSKLPTQAICEKQQPIGTTHIRGTAVVEGGSISMSKPPSFDEK